MQRRNTYAFLLSLVFLSIQLLGCGGGKSAPVAIGGSLPATGTVGVGYLGTLMATGGSGSYMWTVGGLPAGIMASGTTTPMLTVSGTPTAAGTSAFTATVTDSKGHTATFSISIMISAATQTITITGSLPATGAVGTAYTGSLTASGGTAPYMWVVTGLPAGVTSSGTSTATVTASGTPTAVGTSAVSATVTDASANTATFTVSVVISAAGVKLSVKLPVGYPLTATVGTAYSAPAPIVSGGTPPFTFVIAQNAVPGLTMDSTTGAVTGTPTKAGTFKPTLRVTDSATPANVAQNNFTIVVAASGGSTITISPSGLGTLTNGAAVTPVTLTATSTTAPYTWTVTAGSLPAGLVLNNGTTTNATTITSTTNSITITGTPTTTGAYSFTLSITDSATPMGSGSQAFSGTVSAAATAACAPTPALRGNESALTLPYAFLLRGADSSDAPVAWAGSFTPNGSGGITAADIDFVGTAAGPESLHVQLAGSSYSYGSDGRGCLYLVFNVQNLALRPAATKMGNPNLRHGVAHKQVKVRPAAPANPGTVTFSFSLSSASQTGRITQFDFVTSGIVAAGQMHQQNTADFVLSSLASHFVFGLDGWFTQDADGDIARTAIGGSFSNTAGSLSNGTADDNIGGTASGELDGGSGTLTAVSTTTGRGTGSYTITTTDGSLTFDFAYYIVNGSDVLLVSTDDPATVGNFILSGRALVSSATSIALNGFYMAAISGIDLNGGGAGNNSVTIATLQATGAGAIPTATLYANDAGTFGSQTFTNGAYALDTSTGRLTITGVGTGTAPVAYVTATAAEDDIAAFLIGTDSATSSGFLALQGTSAPDFTTGSVSGGFAFGSAEDVTGLNGSLVGMFTFPGDGTYSNVLDIVTVGGTSQPDAAGMGTVVVNKDGSGSFDGGREVLVTNGDLILAIDAASSDEVVQPLLYVFVKQQPAP
jgi:large repetitive protein